MKLSALPLCAAALLALTSLSAPAIGQTQSDNTARNKNHAVTADSQSHAKADRTTTRDIRKALMHDKSLSTYAHNVKVITVNGSVILKGPVRSEEEKQKVLDDATAVAGSDTVVNQITVKR